MIWSHTVALLFAGLFPAVFALSSSKRSGAVTSAEYSFTDFVKEFGRSYEPGTVEWDTRESIFNERMREVKAQQAKPDAKWEAHIGKFGDYTEAEFRKLLGYKRRAHAKRKGFNLLQTAGANWTAPPPGMIEFTFEDQELPKKLDLRSGHKHVTFLNFNRDQGGCGSCWAVATANVMDYHMAKDDSNVVRLSKLLEHSQYPSLATQSLVSCVKNLHHCGGDGGCEGATMQLAFSQIAKDGIPLAQDWSYSSGDGTVERCDARKMSKSKVHIQGYYQIPSNKLNPLMHALVQHGVVGVSVDANSWASYRRGIFDGGGRDFTVNHAVTLYGYTKPMHQQDGYWLIKNSWGPEWGENGFIRLIMYQNEEKHCGMDYATHEGTACDGDPNQDLVCGSCGILYDNSFPAGLTVNEEL